MFFITSDPRENDSFLGTEAPQPANNWRGRCMTWLNTREGKVEIACATILTGSLVSMSTVPIFIRSDDITQKGIIIGALGLSALTSMLILFYTNLYRRADTIVGSRID